MPMRIQPIDFRDASLCHQAWRLQREAYEVEAALIGSRGMQALNESESELAANLTEEFFGCFLETHDGSLLVGLLATERCEYPAGASGPGERWISRLAVATAFARRGIGRALVEHIIEHSATGVGLRVSTGAANLPAVRLYQSVGFVIVEHTTAPDGTPLVRLAHTGRT